MITAAATPFKASAANTGQRNGSQTRISIAAITARKERPATMRLPGSASTMAPAGTCASIVATVPMLSATPISACDQCCVSRNSVTNGPNPVSMSARKKFVQLSAARLRSEATCGMSGRPGNTRRFPASRRAL